MRDEICRHSLQLLGGISLASGCGGPKASGDTGSTDTTASDSGQTSTGQTDEGISSITITPTGGSADSTTAGADSTTGDPSCQGTCAAPAPDGWFGPTIYARLADVTSLPACPAEYPNPGPTLLEGFHDPGPAQCDCSCTLMAGAPCSAQVRMYNGGCAGYWANQQPAGETCTNYALVNRGARIYSYNYGNPGSCQKEDTEFVPPVAWDGAIRTCRVPETPLSCNDGAGVCLPAAPEGFESTWCIYKDGDAECPGGDFGNKFVFHTNAMDSRECTSCACGTAGTSCNDGVVQLFDDADCEGMPAQELPLNGSCQVLNALSFAGSFSDGPPCPVTTMPEPMGEVAAVGPFTFCCG